jgi:LEA14-like dessication related protein
VYHMNCRYKQSVRQRTALILALSSFLAACATTAGSSRLEPPSVTIADIRLANADTVNGRIILAISIFNPNPVRIETSFNYRLTADTILISTGQERLVRFVAPRDSMIVALPVVFTYAGLGPGRQALTRAGEVPYQITGDMTVRSESRVITHRFTHTRPFAIFVR